MRLDPSGEDTLDTIEVVTLEFRGGEIMWADEQFHSGETSARQIPMF
jgi:hypothetical protein